MLDVQIDKFLGNVRYPTKILHCPVAAYILFNSIGAGFWPLPQKFPGDATGPSGSLWSSNTTLLKVFPLCHSGHMIHNLHQFFFDYSYVINTVYKISGSF